MTAWGLRPRDWPLVCWSAFAKQGGRSIAVTEDSDLQQVTVRVRHSGVIERRAKPNRPRRIGTPNQVQVSEGQFVISKIDARNGACGFIPPELDGAIVTHDFPVFDLTESIEARFLDHLVGQPVFWRLCETVSDGTTNRVRLDLDLFDDLQFPLPPLPEQRAIAAVLDSIDEAIERTDEVIAATERLRDSLLHDLLTRGLPGHHTTRRDVPGLGTIPADWEVVRLGECLERIEAGRSPLCESRSARNGEWGVLKVSSVSWGTFQPEENKALTELSEVDPRYEVNAGDIILSRANTPELVGRAVLVRTAPPRLLLSDKTLRLVPERARIEPVFLLLALGLPRSRAQISGSASGSSRSMFNVSQESLRSVRLPLPPLAEQRALAATLDSVEATVERARAERAALQSSKASTADALLTGRVRVPTD